MKMLCLDVPQPGATMEQYAPHMQDEARHAWAIYTGGFIRDIYFRQDRPGVAIIAEADSVESAKAELMQFPQMKNVAIDYCWGGLVDMTKDRFPRAGFHDGLWYAMGYSGHGAQLSTHLGMTIADAILGRPDRNPTKDMPWPAVPGHFGKPWFLPIVGMYYKMLDMVK